MYFLKLQHVGHPQIILNADFNKGRVKVTVRYHGNSTQHLYPTGTFIIITKALTLPYN